MKRISRHSLDAELVQEGVERDQELLASVLEAVGTRAAALSIALGTARSYAGYLAAEGSKTAEICRALRIGAHASAAIFTLGSGKGEISFPIGNRQSTLPATGPTDATHVGNWRIGWWFAHIVRDHSVSDRLASTPISVLRRSSTRGDECQYLFAEALQGFENRNSDWSAKLQAAVDATDPDQVTLSDEEFVLNILVPEMQMLFHLALGEVTPFGAALEFALERHKKYWSKGSRRQDPDGFLALGPLALISIAFDAGMPIAVESEYIPQELIEGICGSGPNR
jgi:hypothetical protein